MSLTLDRGLTRGAPSRGIIYFVGLVLLSGLFGAFGTACSPGSWFGSASPDPAVSGSTSYVEQSAQCAGLQLSGKSLSVAQFRSFVRCLNSNQSIGPLAEWLVDLEDPFLDPFVSLINRYLLGNPDVLDAVAVSYTHLTLPTSG